jgi:hypothetical protein
MVVGNEALAQQAPLTISVNEVGSFVVATGEVRVLPMKRPEKMTAAERERVEYFKSARGSRRGPLGAGGPRLE